MMLCQMIGINFANGAVMAAFAQAFNDLSHPKEKSWWEKTKDAASDMYDSAVQGAGEWLGNNLSQDALNGLTNALDSAAGFANGLSFGLAEGTSNLVYGSGQYANTSSDYYRYGSYAGTGASFFTGGGAVANLYRTPKYLYHFGSSSKGAFINSAGGIPGATQWSTNALYGSGAYLTRSTSPWIARLQGASSTQTVTRISTQGLNVKPTIFPGTFRTPGSSILLK